MALKYSTRERNVQLDLLRCAAIIGVLVAHLTLFRQPRWWWEQLASPSWTGVDLFFVLSGFLISGLLFSEFQKRGRINFARFAIRRALKLYPTLYVLVIAVMVGRFVGQHGLHPAGWIIRPVLHDIFFVQSYRPGTYGPFWSLAVEEHFYILLPLMLYLMLRKARTGETDPFRKLPFVFVLVAIVSLTMRVIHAVVVQPYSDVTHLFPTHFRLDSLLFGVLLSYWYHFHSDTVNAVLIRTRHFLWPISLSLIIPFLIYEKSRFLTHTVGLTSLYLGYGGLMISLLQLPLTTKGFPGFLLSTFSYIGRHSYPIYVFHMLVLGQLSRHHFLRMPHKVPLYFVSTIVVGILFSKLIEFPVLRVRDRLFPPEGIGRIAHGFMQSEEARRRLSFCGKFAL